MKYIFTLFLGMIFSYIAVGQCDNCAKIANAKIDYCYTNPMFPKQCAQFIDKATFFYIQRAGKAIKVNLASEKDLKYLASLAIDKVLKPTAVEILFIQEALKGWADAERKLGFTFTETGLGIKILKEGTGELPEIGKKVLVHYTGFLENGQKFDSSVDRGQPFSFLLGQAQVIKGWDEGIAKLKIGTKAVLKIPASLGYGSRGAGNGLIPPNATLYFEVELLGVQ